jgi:iron complex outermembrane receptor protein
VNLYVGNSDIYQGLGFMVTYRWQDSYYWQSFLVNGDVPAYQTVDMQVSKKLKQVLVKVGGSNVFNHYYNSFLGGPSVGGFYYVTVGYGL